MILHFLTTRCHLVICSRTVIAMLGDRIDRIGIGYVFDATIVDGIGLDGWSPVG